MSAAVLKNHPTPKNTPTIVGVSLYLVYWFTGILFGYIHPDALDRLSAPSPDVAFSLTALVWCFAVPMGYVVAVKHLSKDLFTRIHARWVERTYWFTLLWVFCSSILVIVAVVAFADSNSRGGILASLSIFESAGFIVLSVMIWCFYRVVRGLISYALGRLPSPGYALNDATNGQERKSS